MSTSLQQQIAALLENEHVVDYFQVTVEDTVIYEERFVGRGRRGPNRPRERWRSIAWY